MSESKPPPGLFEGAACYYARYRRHYAPQVIDVLVEQYSLSRTTHALDLGCGTGQLAIPLAGRGVPVHAVDPSAEMLAEGIRAAKAADSYGVQWQLGDDQSLDRLHLPPLRLACMAASFHWMDRDQVLIALDRMIEPGGGVAVLAAEARSGSVWTSTTGWQEAVRQTVVDFLGPRRRAGSGTFQTPIELHESVLSRSPFSRVERIAVNRMEERTVDELVGLQLSKSYATPAHLGDWLQGFCARLRERLIRLEPSGIFREEYATEIFVAKR